MAIRTNPFHELYVGESVGPDKFVGLFSDVIVKHALSLFQPGHVILKGLPGSGKSMLLNLLKPKIRLAYEKAGQNFPVPTELMKFIGAGINLKRSGISDFGQRPIGDQEQNKLVSPIYFGDFLNYWVVADIFNSIRILSEVENLPKKIGIDNNQEKCNVFAKKLAQSDCWLGFMADVADFKALESKINDRITNYRKFLNYASEDLPQEIHETKTLIGIPISKTVQLLKECGIIEDNTEVYIRIDQYEELAWLDESTNGLGTSYREVIHKLLGMRDSNVSYRIGTRYFAWKGDEKMYGSAATLEKKRNYSVISIDSVFKRPENSRTWAFPEFAEDIFLRRLKLSPYKIPNSKDSLIAKVFGSRLSPLDTAKHYVPNVPEKAIIIDNHWPENWKALLKNLALEDPLSARLAEAWARQKGKENIVQEGNWPKPYPWENKKWWKKERTEQALTQIASRNNQRLIYYGKDDIMGLSGGHILVFLSLCQHIWDVWIRDNRNEAVDPDMKLPALDEVIQTAGIREASNDWYEDISKVKGGKERKTFIDYLGLLFFKLLVEDKPMSYPGRNGFSLTVEDFEKNKMIYDFITEACNYGDLYDTPHTSKLKDKKPRRKFYLNPIFSPYFKIPYAHTKEPMYVTLPTVADWLIECKIFEKKDFPEIVKVNKPAENSNIDQQGKMDF
jgi:hypothetical protein